MYVSSGKKSDQYPERLCVRTFQNSLNFLQFFLRYIFLKKFSVGKEKIPVDFVQALISYVSRPCLRKTRINTQIPPFQSEKAIYRVDSTMGTRLIKDLSWVFLEDCGPIKVLENTQNRLVKITKTLSTASNLSFLSVFGFLMYIYEIILFAPVISVEIGKKEAKNPVVGEVIIENFARGLYSKLGIKDTHKLT